jgi:predicted transcriptional regulator of viral defense system
VDNTTSTNPSNPRETLSTLARSATGGLISTPAAAQALGVTTRVAAARLRRLVAAGWVARVRRGLFLLLPLEASNSASTTVEDPWLLAMAVLAPCYIGGWSAAEHWRLTEQIFRSTFVATASGARARSRTLLGAEFHVVRVPQDRLTGTVQIWRGAARVAISDRERTIADALTDPGWVGGVRHLVEILIAYRRSPEWNPTKLLKRMAELGRGAAYKRLGFLAEKVLDAGETVVAACMGEKSSGTIKLDPGVAGEGPLVKRWGIQVNVRVTADEERSA